MMGIADWRDGVNTFVDGKPPIPPGIQKSPADWHAGYRDAQTRTWMDGATLSPAWASDPGKVDMNQGLAASAVNQEGTGQHPTDQWPGRTMHYGARLTALERDIKTIFGCLDAQSARLNKHEARMDAHARRIAALEENFKTHQGCMEDHSRLLIEHGERLDGHHKRHMKLSNEVRMGDDLAMRLDTLVQRLDGMEERAIQMIVSRLKEALNG